MNLSLLREYVKPVCKVYLKCKMGIFYQYYVPCYVKELSISNMSTSYTMPDINFELVFVHDPDKAISDISIDRIYVIFNNDLVPLEKYISSIDEAYIVGGRGLGKSTTVLMNALNYLYRYSPGKYTPIDPFEPDYFDSKKIIFSGNCTIVIWKDGTKTMARCSKGDDFSPEAGLAICFMKHVLGESKAKKILRNGNKIFESEVEG